jgi:hypothetical protein
MMSSNAKQIAFLGYGTLVESRIPAEAVGFLAESLRELGRDNPTIELDSGKIVFGCECWWGPEDEIRKIVEKHPNVVEVDIDTVREQYTQEKR